MEGAAAGRSQLWGCRGSWWRGGGAGRGPNGLAQQDVRFYSRCEESHGGIKSHGMS